MEEKGKVYWHEAFCEALYLELFQYKDVKIEKNIGKIFKRWNIFEYKSESDNFTYWDYRKLHGYLSLYSAFEKVPLPDLTLSIALTMYPRELVKTLESEHGFRANLVAFKEAVKMSEAVREIFLETAEENGWLDNRDWIMNRDIEKAKVIARKLLLRGLPVEDVSEDTGLPIDTVILVSSELEKKLYSKS